jgi:hypothetical protein
MPALLDELGGQPEIRPLSGFPVELHQRGLDDRVAVDARHPAQEDLHQVVGEPARHRHQLGRAGGALVRDRGLDEVARAVQLVAGGKLGVTLARGHLDVGVQVPVGLLGLLQQRDRLGREAGQGL